MSYTYNNLSFVKAKGQNTKWVSLNQSTLLIKDILKDYAGCWLYLTAITNQIVVFDLIANRSLIANQNLTISAWLLSRGNASLPTQPFNSFAIQKTTAQYRDAYLANYESKGVSPFTHPSVSVAEEAKTDLLLTRLNTDYLEMAKKVIVTVNGMLHRTEGSVNGLYVRDGYLTSKKSNDNNIGILSFGNIGDISIIPITEDKIYKQNPSQSLYKGAYINAGVDLSNKTVFLVLGGYLHALDGQYEIIGQKEIFVNLGRYQLPQRFYAALQYIKMDSLTENMHPGSKAMSVSEMRSDAWITKYLTLSQSFIIVVDTPSMYANKIMVENAGLGGIYISGQKPTLPLLTAYGKMAPYWPVHEYGKWSLHCKDNFVPNYMFETTDWWTHQFINSARDNLTPFSYANGYLLELGKETIQPQLI